MNRFSSMSPARQALILATIVLVGCLLLFAVAEGAVRVRQWIRYGDTASLEEAIKLDPELGIRVVEPNTDVVLAKRAHVETNGHGFRSPSIEPGDTPAGTLRLAFLGGSTTFCAEATDNSWTWPAQVAEQIQQQVPGLRVEFINAAVPGHRVPHSIINYDRRVKPFDPDIVFIYHAHNDLTWESQQLARVQGLYQPQKSDFLSSNSLLIALVKKNLVWSLREERGTRIADDGEGTAAQRLDVDREALARQFEGRMRDLVARIEADGATPVIVTFSSRARPDQDEELKLANVLDSFQVMPFYRPDDILDGYARFNAASRRVAQRSNGILVDMADQIPGDGKHFNDSIHFNDAGMRVMGLQVGKAVLESPRFRQLLQGKRSPPKGG